MDLFHRFTSMWTKDQDGQVATLRATLAEANDSIDALRVRAEAAERELRPFQDYVEASDAMAAAAAADAARERDEAAPTESGDGAEG